MELNVRTFDFIGPSGFGYAIREQNGQDEEILSNQADAKNLMNLTKFIMAIVVSTDFPGNVNGRLSMETALELPLLDRYAIILHSRIFSLGEEVEFEYDWGKENGGKQLYSQDLREYLLDYAVAHDESVFEENPNAIRPYPIPINSDKRLKKELNFTLASGKQISFKIMDGNGEVEMLSIPKDKVTRHSDLFARDLRLKVGDTYEKVQNFSLFTPRDMAEIRKYVNKYDPIFTGISEIVNPVDQSQKAEYPILASPNFFFLTEAQV